MTLAADVIVPGKQKMKAVASRLKAPFKSSEKGGTYLILDVSSTWLSNSHGLENISDISSLL